MFVHFFERGVEKTGDPNRVEPRFFQLLHFRARYFFFNRRSKIILLIIGEVSGEWSVIASFDIFRTAPAFIGSVSALSAVATLPLFFYFLTSFIAFMHRFGELPNRSFFVINTKLDYQIQSRCYTLQSFFLIPEGLYVDHEVSVTYQECRVPSGRRDGL